MSITFLKKIHFCHFAQKFSTFLKIFVQFDYSKAGGMPVCLNKRAGAGAGYIKTFNLILML